MTTEISQTTQDLLNTLAEVLIDEVGKVDEEFLASLTHAELGNMMTPHEVEEAVGMDEISTNTVSRWNTARLNHLRDVLRQVTTELVAKSALRMLWGADDETEARLDELAAAGDGMTLRAQFADAVVYGA